MKTKFKTQLTNCPTTGAGGAGASFWNEGQ